MGSLDGHSALHEDEVLFLSENASPSSPLPEQSSHNHPRTQSDIANNLEQMKKDSSIKRRLYISHLLSTWNSRVFEFGAVLLLAHIVPDTLLPASLYALVRAASAICLSPMVGRYVDRGDRLKVARRSIVGQRAAVLLSCPAFWLLGIAPIFALSGRFNPMPLLSFGILSVLACVEKVYSIMNLIAIERDWVVVIAENSSCELEALNAQMRRIDLACKLLGPLMIALIDAVSFVLVLEVILGMNVLSLLIEYFAIADVYKMVPALRFKELASTSPADSAAVFQDIPVYRRIPAFSISKAQAMYKELSDYSRHAAFLPSFALCLLYLTVLSFSGQMVTYLLSVNITPLQIGLLRTASTAVELSATWLTPIAMKRIGTLRSGLWFINWQLCCLIGAVSSFWLIDKPIVAALILVAGMILSRVGLWGFDLCVQIIVQEVCLESI